MTQYPSSQEDYDAGFSAAVKGIVAWMRNEDFGKDAPQNTPAFGMYMGIQEAANDIEDGAPWNE